MNNPDELEDMEEGGIERPDITVAHIILLILAQKGRATFRELSRHPMTRAIGVERTENSFYTALSRLQRRRQIARRPDHTYELLPGGEFAALKALVRKEFVERERALPDATRKEPRWDGKWRLILFDIPESKRATRDYLRSVLKRAGCHEFQRSMWMYPHKLPLYIMKLLSDPLMRKYTRTITSMDIDYDEDLRRIFKLR
jgi:DNA-binding transcriptional regulator PaaX